MERESEREEHMHRSKHIQDGIQVDTEDKASCTTHHMQLSSIPSHHTIHKLSFPSKAFSSKTTAH